MGFCPANCADLELVPLPQEGGCEVLRRKRSLYKLGFYPCAINLPSPLTCEALQELVESNVIVFSNPLANVEWGEPTIEENPVADCLPYLSEIAGRSLTFDDLIAITANEGTSGVPALNKFADYPFWKDKQKQRLTLRIVLLFCDGTLEIPKDENGSPTSASLMVYRTFTRQGSGRDSYLLEIKRGVINFKGDPLLFEQPELTIEGEGCEELATSLGLDSLA
jgi:hypothetical protein